MWLTLRPGSGWYCRSLPSRSILRMHLLHCTPQHVALKLDAPLAASAPARIQARPARPCHDGPVVSQCSPQCDWPSRWSFPPAIFAEVRRPPSRGHNHVRSVNWLRLLVIIVERVIGIYPYIQLRITPGLAGAPLGQGMPIWTDPPLARRGPLRRAGSDPWRC